MKKRFPVYIPNYLSIKSPQWIFDEMVKGNHIHLCKIGLYLGDEPFLSSAEDLEPKAVDLDTPVPSTSALSHRLRVVAEIKDFALEGDKIYIDVETIEGFSVESPNWEAACNYTPLGADPGNYRMHIVLKNIGGDDLYALSPTMIEVADVAP